MPKPAAFQVCDLGERRAPQFATTGVDGLNAAAATMLSSLPSAHRRELGVTLEMLVGLREQVSVDLGASPYIATDQTQSLDAYSGHGAAVAA
jgi:hypothetical protein